VNVFASRRPTLGELLDSRSQSFDRAHAVLPSTAVAGERLGLTAQVWDGYERQYPGFDGAFRVETTDPEADHPDRIDFRAAATAVQRAGVTFNTPGVQYLTLVHEGTGDRYRANPVQVHESAPERRIYWGDIHLHSTLSDGTGRLAKGYRFGRRVMDLDVVAYTDHDTMGFFIPPSRQRRRMHDQYFDRMRDVAEAFNDPGEFVTLFAYEWTKQPYKGGHVNVYFDDPDAAELVDSHEAPTPGELFDALRDWRDRTGERVLAIPHHSAEASYPFDFSAVEYDDDIAPLVEVYSQWGSSEAPASAGNDNPVTMGDGEVDEPGHYVQDALALGERVGMLAAADYHGPHPGHSLVHADPHLPALGEWLDSGLGWGNIWRVWNEPSYPGGLTAFRATELTREAIFDALSTRRVYGTSQPHRILIDFAVNGVSVGEADSRVELDAADDPREVTVEVAGTRPLARVTVVKNNEDWHVVEGTDDAGAGLEEYTTSVSVTDDEPVTGMAFDAERGTDDDTYYLRVEQAGEGLAWAGPIWVGT
jgi:hypothetical protein